VITYKLLSGYFHSNTVQANISLNIRVFGYSFEPYDYPVYVMYESIAICYSFKCAKLLRNMVIMYLHFTLYVHMCYVVCVCVCVCLCVYVWPVQQKIWLVQTFKINSFFITIVYSVEYPSFSLLWWAVMTLESRSNYRRLHLHSYLPLAVLHSVGVWLKMFTMKWHINWYMVLVI